MYLKSLSTHCSNSRSYTWPHPIVWVHVNELDQNGHPPLHYYVVAETYLLIFFHKRNECVLWCAQLGRHSCRCCAFGNDKAKYDGMCGRWKKFNIHLTLTKAAYNSVWSPHHPIIVTNPSFHHHCHSRRTQVVHFRSLTPFLSSLCLLVFVLCSYKKTRTTFMWIDTCAIKTTKIFKWKMVFKELFQRWSTKVSNV